MRWKMFYPFPVWFISLVLSSLICACWPVLRSGFDFGQVSFLWRVGFFAGVFCFAFEYSVYIFLSLYLLCFLFTAWCYLSDRFIKFLLIVCFLIWIFIINRSEFPETWLHPFFMVYSAVTIPGLLLFKIYRYDAYYYE